MSSDASLDLNAKKRREEPVDEEKPILRRTMSGMGMIGLGRRDVWKPMGLGWNLAIKAQHPPASDNTLSQPDGEKEEEM